MTDEEIKYREKVIRAARFLDYKAFEIKNVPITNDVLIAVFLNCAASRKEELPKNLIKMLLRESAIFILENSIFRKSLDCTCPSWETFFSSIFRIKDLCDKETLDNYEQKLCDDLINERLMSGTISTAMIFVRFLCIDKLIDSIFCKLKSLIGSDKTKNCDVYLTDIDRWLSSNQK